MAEELLRECLSFPALARGEQEEFTDTDAVGQRRRVHCEKLSRTKLVENLKRASPPQLEQAVVGSKRQLRVETLHLGLQQRLVARAVREPQVRLSPLAQAELEEREDLVLDILKLQRAIHAQDFQLAQAQARERALASKRPRVEEEQPVVEEEESTRSDLKKEQRALRHLFFVLIMESGVRWTEDKVLREIVFSFR